MHNSVRRSRSKNVVPKVYLIHRTIECQMCLLFYSQLAKIVKLSC